MIDLPRELESLLDAWRIHRAAATAALVDELSSFFAPALPAVAGRTRTELHRAWLARATVYEPVDVPALLATVTDGTAAQVTERLEVIGVWPQDPRVTWLAKRMLEAPPFATSSGDQKVWRRLFVVIENHNDPRAASFLGAPAMAKVFDTTVRGENMRQRAAALCAFLARIVVPPDAQHEARAARLASLLADGRAIRDDPEGRDVLRDWLIERGYVLRDGLIRDA